MEVFTNYNDIPANWHPLVLTIGKFDAVHRGHGALLDQAKAVALQLHGHLCLLTFANHPIEVLKEGTFIQRLCTQAHKLKLLAERGVDGILQVEFTKQFAKQTAEEFIQSLHQKLAFKALILGYDARIGSDRQGNSSIMHQLASKFGFSLQYIPPCKTDHMIVSSSLIRKAICNGDLITVEKMLGRKYSILAYVAMETPYQASLANLSDLCLPPPGNYPVKVYCENWEVTARAEIRKEVPILVLEFDQKKCKIGNKPLEVIFGS